jgi:GMP synthase (glutamine-hydrolysing)
MRAYLKVQAPDLEKEGLDAKALIENVIDAPNATSLLGRFSRLVLNGLPTDH